MGRKRSKKGTSATQCSPGLSVGDSYGPLSTRAYTQDALDLAIQNSREYREASAARDKRLNDAGFTFYHQVSYKGEHVGITDIQGDIAYVDYSGNQFRVRFEDIERIE